MNARLNTAPRKKQQGAVLAISLIMLLVMTLVGVAAMQNTVMEEKMAGNMGNAARSLQAAESALRAAETFLAAGGLPAFDGSAAGLYKQEDVGTAPIFMSSTVWNSSTTSVTYGTSLYGIPTANLPKYIIEELAPVPDLSGSQAADEPLPDATVYRITARGVDGTGNTVTRLQSIYKL